MSEMIRAFATAPDQKRYVLVGSRSSPAIGTGSLVLDALALLWGLVRRTRGRGWIVSVWPDGKPSDVILSRRVGTAEQAAVWIHRIGGQIEDGSLPVRLTDTRS